MDSQAVREMPRYQSHKKVWTLKIAAMEIHDDKSAMIAPADEGYATFTTRAGWAERFDSSKDDTGYYVQYEDGFTSWSPTSAFENVYTRIDWPSGGARAAAEEVHPPPEEFTPEEVDKDPILQFFHYSHLPPGLQARSRKFFELVRWVVDYSPRSAERTVCLRKILEAKDAGVRCAVAR